MLQTCQSLELGYSKESRSFKDFWMTLYLDILKKTDMLIKNIKTGFLLLLSLQLLSCKESKINDDIEIVKLNTNDAKPGIKLSEISGNPKFIKLYTDSLFLIGDIRQIFYAQDKIYLQNFTKILVYNADGTPEFIINNKGKAAEEYYEINDFYVDTVKNRIKVWDRVKRKMLVYHGETGDYINSFGLNIDARYFKILENNYIFYGGLFYSGESGSEADIIFVDENGNILKKCFAHQYKSMYSFSTPEYFSVCDDKIYYDDAPLSIIWKVSENNCKPLYKFEINNNTLQLDDYLLLKDLRAPKRFKKLLKEYNFSTGQTNVFKYGIKFIVNGNSKSYLGFYSFNTKNSMLSQALIEDEYLNVPIWYSNIIGNKLICSVNSHKLLEADLDLQKLNKQNHELYNIIRATNKYDNPLLIISDLKEF